MRVSHITVKKSGKTIIYSAKLTFEKKGLNTILYFQIDEQFANSQNIEDAFFVVSFPLAAAVKEELIYDGTVSRKLYSRVNAIKRKLQLDWKQSKIQVQTTKRNTSDNKGIAQVFTLGTDSFYTLLCFKPPLFNNEKITHLLFTEGFDVPLKNTELLELVKHNIKQIADKQKLTPIYIKTNLREFSEPILDWGYFHGAALAAVSLLISGQVSKVYINAADGYKKNHISGTRADIDQLWSTENMKFSSFGISKNRAEKVFEILKSSDRQLFTRYLRVCNRDLGKDFKKYNCSVCAKCVRTLLSIKIGGYTGRLESFDPLTIDTVKKIRIPADPHNTLVWKQTFQALCKISKPNDPLIHALTRVFKYNNVYI